jgi:hypothetical protein
MRGLYFGPVNNQLIITQRNPGQNEAVKTAHLAFVFDCESRAICGKAVCDKF